MKTEEDGGAVVPSTPLAYDERAVHLELLDVLVPKFQPLISDVETIGCRSPRSHVPPSGAGNFGCGQTVGWLLSCQPFSCNVASAG